MPKDTRMIDAFFYSTVGDIPKFNVMKILIQCHDLEAQKSVYKLTNELENKNIPVIFSNPSLIFSTENQLSPDLKVEDFVQNELIDYINSGKIVLPKPQVSIAIEYGQNPRDYSEFLYSCIRAYHKGNGHWFHHRKGTFKINLERFPLAGSVNAQYGHPVSIIKGLSLHLVTSRTDKILLKADAFAELSPREPNPPGAHIVKLRKHSMVPPKERYEYVEKNLESIFGDSERLEIMLPDNISLPLEKVQFF